MANIFKYYIEIIFIINFFFSNSEENIIENPKLIISNFQYPILFNGNNEHYNIITSGKIYTTEKLTGNIVSADDSNSYNPPYFLCIDESKNYSLYANKEYYYISLTSNFLINNLNKVKTITTDSNIKFIGCIKEGQYNDQVNNINIAIDEIITYGKNSNTLHIHYITKSWGDNEIV